MVNFLKGYTRNGIRRSCWLASQGEDYLIKVQSSRNIKQKFGVFERVRCLAQRNEVCRQLISDF